MNKGRTDSRKLYIGGVSLVCIFAAVLGIGYVGKNRALQAEAATRATVVADGPFVVTAKAEASPSERQISVLGETRPYASVTLYSKVSGYLDRISVDTGDRVKKGQLLASINSPESVRELQGALANSRNKQAIAGRIRQLHDRKLISDQEADQALSDSDMAQAQLVEAKAVKGYEEIRAPFDGTVTARFADPGALVQSAANSQSSALPIVTVSQTEKLRVTVYLDQRDAAYVKVGDPASITLAERPGKVYKAVVTREAGELDPRSRTLLTEMELDNSSGEILAGSFVDVVLNVKAPSVVQVPVEAMVMRGSQPFIAMVKNGTVHYQEVQIGENDGTTVDVASGLNGGDVVALNLGNNLTEGQRVQTGNEDAK